ncbi:MAG: hypothetical protein HY074_15245 [Deltaproteobacteria bacterium]|nr:hypothetical protein [Deltaproteobacteria bacterium]
MNALKPLFQTRALFAFVVGLLACGTVAEARYLGSCVSLLTKDAAVSRVENPDSVSSAMPGQAMSLVDAQAALGRYSLQTTVTQTGRIEILPDGNPDANQLARAAHVLANDPVYRSAQFPFGLRLVLDPALDTADGFLDVEAGEIRLSAATLADHPLAFATVAHEMSHAEQLSLWLNATGSVSAINTVARGQVPGLENSRYAKLVSAQEMPATAVGRHIYEQYKGSPNADMSTAGRKISKSYLDMTAEILGVLDGLTPAQRATIYVTNYRTTARNGNAINVEYHVGSYSNIKKQNFFASIKVLKRTMQGMREYRLEIPLPSDTTTMSAGAFLDLILSQVRSLQGMAQKYDQLFAP